jgi:hypothetical protein
MARPKTTDARRRARLGQFRMTAEEELSVKMNAAAAGLSVSDFLRRRALGLTVTPPASRVDAALVSELNRIGVNVNQLAFAHNADREFKGDWEAIRDQLSRVLEKVALAYGS